MLSDYHCTLGFMFWHLFKTSPNTACILWPMCLLRWSYALHLILLCWLTTALQVMEGKIHTVAALSHVLPVEKCKGWIHESYRILIRNKKVWQWINSYFNKGERYSSKLSYWLCITWKQLQWRTFFHNCHKSCSQLYGRVYNNFTCTVQKSYGTFLFYRNLLKLVCW